MVVSQERREKRLARLIAVDVELQGSTSPLNVAAQKLAQSLARSMENRKAALALFTPPTPLQWASLSAPAEPLP